MHGPLRNPRTGLGVVQNNLGGFVTFECGLLSAVYTKYWFEKRTIRPLKVCFRCLATKGTADEQWSYSNVDPSAPWRSTLFVDDPWPNGIVPTLTGILGFSMLMIGVDLLHVLHLGCGRDLAGTAIRFLASKRGYWRGGTQEERLRVATQRLKWHAKQSRHSLTISKLCKKSINWKSDDYPEVKCKGFDTFLILRWLVWEIGNKDIGNDLLATVIWLLSSGNCSNLVFLYLIFFCCLTSLVFIWGSQHMH